MKYAEIMKIKEEVFPANPKGPTWMEIERRGIPEVPAKIIGRRYPKADMARDGYATGSSPDGLEFYSVELEDGEITFSYACHSDSPNMGIVEGGKLTKFGFYVLSKRAKPFPEMAIWHNKEGQWGIVHGPKAVKGLPRHHYT